MPCTTLFTLMSSSLAISLRSIAGRIGLYIQGFFGALSDLTAAASGAAQVVTVGAGESVVRWLLLPHVNELMASPPKLIFNFCTFPTDKAVSALKDGSIDIAVVREDAVSDSVTTLNGGVMDYCLVAPRSLIPGRSAAGFKMAQNIPFAMLGGEGALAKQVAALAEENGYSISVRL